MKRVNSFGYFVISDSFSPWKAMDLAISHLGLVDAKSIPGEYYKRLPEKWRKKLKELKSQDIQQIPDWMKGIKKL